jgi:hypothetical protein
MAVMALINIWAMYLSFTVIIIPKVTRCSAYYKDINYNHIGKIFMSVIPQLLSIKQGQAAGS